MSHENDKLKFGAPGDAIVMACTQDVNPNDDSVRYYGGLLVCESASAEWRRRIVACVNACAGSSTEWLEFIVSDDAIDQLGGPRPFETRHGEVLREALRIMAERDKAEKQRDELLTALNDVATRIKDHPAYEELTEDEEMSIGGDTAELSYLARICDSAMSCVQQSAESETQSSLTRIDETQTSIPAIVFYPAGSLGEAVEEWGSHGA